MSRIVVKNFIQSKDGPSNIQISFLKQLELTFKGRVEFEHLNAKENESQVQKYKVRELPTIIIECDNKERERFKGLTQPLFLRKAIEKILSECK
jgi:thioredoxin-like negative regulator of GroEL